MNITIDEYDADQLRDVITAVAEAQNLGMANGILFMWIVYEHPADYPHHYVARAHGIHEGKQTATESLLISRKLEPLQSVLEIAGLVKLARHASDEKQIVEVWT